MPWWPWIILENNNTRCGVMVGEENKGTREHTTSLVWFWEIRKYGNTEKFQRSVEENKHDNGLKQEWATLRINVACTAFKPRGENSIYPIKVRNWNDSQKNFFKKNKKDTWMVSSAKL